MTGYAPSPIPRRFGSNGGIGTTASKVRSGFPRLSGSTLCTMLALIGGARQAQRFEAVRRQTAATQPALLPRLSRRPIRALDLADRWERLLAVVACLQAHPGPGVYLRQVDVSGVDSKFIEAHRGVLGELLDLALPASVVETGAMGVAQFTRRFGFLDKPVRIRFRLLDPALPSLPGCHALPGVLPDITLDATSLVALVLPVERVFIILGRHRHPRIRHPRPIACLLPARGVLRHGP